MAFPFLIPALAAGAGAFLNRDDPLKGALIGGGLGFGAGALGLGAGAGAGGGLLAPSAGAAGSAIPVTTSVPSFVAPGASGGLTSLLPGSLAGAPNFGAAGLSQGAAASALGGGALPAAAGETAALGLSQPAAAQALADPSQGPITQEFFSKGFKNKLTTGLIDAAPTAAAALLRPGQQAPTAPAGQLNRPQFTPAQNLFLNFQRRRR